MIWEDTVAKKLNYEQLILNAESNMVDNLTNFDKIIYRGQIENEMTKYENNTNNVIESSTEYNRNINAIVLNMTIFINFIFLFSIGYLIKLKVDKKLTAVIFITLLSIITMYRDKMIAVTSDFSEFVEFFGRTKQVLVTFDELSGIADGSINKQYNSVDIPFDKVVFKNVDFRYKNTEVDIFKNLNMTLNLKDKIIGITGLSGNGKSTFVKLLLKLYKRDSGEMYIDNKNIDEIDPSYIRKNIIYVNQNSKLFDKKIIDNILYGCSVEDVCKKYFDEIMRYPKIVDLYKNIDLYEKRAGMGGESLSGGQRQIINIINGMVNPAPILVIDEPTNALDGILKKELIGLIKDMKKYKKCIIIITHDREVYPLFDESISI
jgi:ABC-type bacteriocin/lantibiotic exporter with double-glycine peptidase domain